MKVSCVVLTTGERPRELQAAIDSVHGQQGVDVEVLVVRNVAGPSGEDVQDGVRTICPGDNLGIPGGRNVGAERAGGELLLFLDDDAVLADPGVLARVAALFEDDLTLGAVSMRLVDPASGRTERRHVPRLRVGDPQQGSWVTTFLGGACVIRREAFEAAGGLPTRFFYAHEETSLAWRMIDRGYRIRYEPSAVVHHPAVGPSQHAQYYYLTGRNRALLARQHLPAPVAVVYLAVWTLLSLARERGGRRHWLRGLIDGLRARDVQRRPIGWRTVWQLTRYGRPPVI